jgi:hypothetical protein
MLSIVHIFIDGVQLGEPKIYGRNVGTKLSSIFPSLGVGFVQVHEVVVKVLVAGGHQGERLEIIELVGLHRNSL